MSTMRYYRVSDAAALQAWDAYSQQVLALKAKGEAFAAMFPNAKPVYSYSLHGTTLHGLVFSPAMKSPLWTFPNAKEGNTQRPRSALPGQGISDRRAGAQELKDLNAQWAEQLPRERPSLDAFWESIGTDWGNLLFAGIQYRLADDRSAIYIGTTATLAPHCVEITGSEFDAKAAAA